MLAYLRSALALMAAGVALWQFTDSPLETGVGAAMLGTGFVIALLAYGRWRRIEVALRKADPIPYPVLPILMATTLVTAAVVLLAARLA